MPATIICLINQKGGCGKSSTCFHLSGYFAESGQNVLLVDADPQGSLSQGFFGSTAIENLSPPETLAALFDDGLFVTPDALIRTTPFSRISLIPANYALASCNVPQPEFSGMRQFALREFLRPLDTFDVVLIDCPPNLYQCSWNALLAADFVLIPVPPEDFGTQGLRTVHQAIEHARTLNPSLDLFGHVVTRSDRRLLVHRSYERMLRQVYGASVLETVIPEASAFKVALAARQPVTHHAPLSRGAQNTWQLGRELTRRMQNRAAAQWVA